MVKRVFLFYIILSFVSPVLTCIELESRSGMMSSSCSVHLQHARIENCCCEKEHEKVEYNNDSEIPVAVNIPSITNKVFYISYTRPILYENLEISQFYTPLKTIRLLL